MTDTVQCVHTACIKLTNCYGLEIVHSFAFHILFFAEFSYKEQKSIVKFRTCEKYWVTLFERDCIFPSESLSSWNQNNNKKIFWWISWAENQHFGVVFFALMAFILRIGHCFIALTSLSISISRSSSLMFAILCGRSTKWIQLILVGESSPFWINWKNK